MMRTSHEDPYTEFVRLFRRQRFGFLVTLRRHFGRMQTKKDFLRASVTPPKRQRQSGQSQKKNFTEKEKDLKTIQVEVVLFLDSKILHFKPS